MALFTINRFMGDDEDEEEKARPGDILARLKSQAEARKKARSVKSKTSSHEQKKEGKSGKRKHGSEESLQEKEVDGKKKKKNKRRERVPDEDSVENDTEIIKDRKKKKKYIHRDSAHDEDSVKSDNSEMNTNGKKKKKKYKHRDSAPDEDSVESEDSEMNGDRKKKKYKHGDSVPDEDSLESEDSEMNMVGKKKKNTNRKNLKHKLSDSQDSGALKTDKKIKKLKYLKSKNKKEERHKHLESNETDEDESCSDSDAENSINELSENVKKSEKGKKDISSGSASSDHGDSDAAAEEGEEAGGEEPGGEAGDKEDSGAMLTVEEGGQEIGGFTVLGDIRKKEKTQVKRVLPDWLASPSVISADLRNKHLPITEMTGLDDTLVSKLAENGITHFFPVQMQVIPHLLEVIKHGCHVGTAGYRPHDVCVSAPTGSGKTLAFVLPIVEALRSRVVRKIRAVVVLPVKDLAVQVYKVFKTYIQGTELKVGLAVGQKAFMNEQNNLVLKKLRGMISLVDILVATPGRLVDHITKTDGFDLSHLRFLVIDEADRMMDDIKQDWLSTLEDAVYQHDVRDVPGSITVANCSKIQIPLQKLLFSATLSQNPEKLQQLNLFQPCLFTSVVKVTLEEERRIGRALTSGGEAAEDVPVPKQGEFIGKYTTPLGLTEYFGRCTAGEKPLYILHLLRHLKFRHILCFTNTREATHRLYLLVKQFEGVRVQEFSSNLSATKRNRIIEDFAASKIDLLICSDAMARGMDVENVKYVISYDTTPDIKTYIHRIGRTARAGKVGTAITLLENKEVYHFKKMVQEADKTAVKEMEIDTEALKPLIPAYQDALQHLPELLMAEKRKKKQKG